MSDCVKSREESDILVESIFTQVTAHARLLVAPERHTEVRIIDAVDL